MKIYKNIYAEINLDNLVHNLRVIKDLNKGQKIIAVVKDNAYGHGAVEISKRLIKNDVEMLAVGCVKEAIELREGGVNTPILIMGVTPLEYIDELLEYDFVQTITGDEYYFLLLSKLKKMNKKLKVHIKIDTGMGRVGLFASDENYEIVNNICCSTFFDVQGIYSHFSNSDDLNDTYTMTQYETFKLFCNNLNKLGLNIKYRHMCNSSGSLNFKFNYLNCVRPGLALYGYGFSNEIKINLKPVMSLKGRIVHIKKVGIGEFIGYGKTYEVKRESLIATINVGYGHGYPRYLSNNGRVIFKGDYANIVGNICMDHFMIDVTHIKDVNLFDEVTLIGEYKGKRVFADDISKIGNTICYEVLCGIRRKIQRVYLDCGNILKIV